MIDVVYELELDSLLLLESLFIISFQLEKSDSRFEFFLKNLFDIDTSSIAELKFMSAKQFLSLKIDCLCSELCLKNS